MRVDIWSDVVCPWCYIGKRRLEGALKRFPHRDQIEVTWRSFELDPAAPPSADDPIAYDERLAYKYDTTIEQAQSMIDTVRTIAASEGLDFRFEVSRPGNTFDAHRLLHLAREQGLQDDLKERLDNSTFTQGLAVSDHDQLTRIAVETGLDQTEVSDVLASERYADAVRADQAEAAAYGIHAVPFFVIDEKYGVEGAQPADHLLAALTQAWDERAAPA